MSFKDMFELKTDIVGKRQKFYSNPAVGNYSSLLDDIKYIFHIIAYFGINLTDRNFFSFI